MSPQNPGTREGMRRRVVEDALEEPLSVCLVYERVEERGEPAGAEVVETGPVGGDPDLAIRSYIWRTCVSNAWR